MDLNKDIIKTTNIRYGYIYTKISIFTLLKVLKYIDHLFTYKKSTLSPMLFYVPNGIEIQFYGKRKKNNLIFSIIFKKYLIVLDAKMPTTQRFRQTKIYYDHVNKKTDVEQIIENPFINRYYYIKNSETKNGDK